MTILYIHHKSPIKILRAVKTSMSPFFQDFYLDFLIVARTKEKKQLEKTGTLMFLPRYDQNNILKIGMFSDKKVQGIAQNLIKIYSDFG